MRDDFGRQVGLNRKYVLDPAVVTARPEMRTAARIDQLRTTRSWSPARRALPSTT